MRPETGAPAAAALIILILLAGCASTPPTSSGSSLDPDGLASSSRPADTSKADGLEPPSGLWARIRRGFRLNPDPDRPAIRQWVQFYATHRHHLLSSARRARPFLWHIVEAIDKRGMPMELALLPIVESAYKPFARSYAGAVGLWQFIPITARRFGLDRDWWYDERRDVFSATKAALKYLSLLHERFDSWLLALAGYNAGGGRVEAAIRAAREAGRPTDFWHLDLPRQTENYVPKLLALHIILKQPAQFALDWPELPNKPLTRRVSLPGQIELKRAAEMLDMSVQALRHLNPEYRRWATHPEGPHRLLVPADEVKEFRTALAKADPDSLMTPRVAHRVSRGDTLSSIAQHYGTTVAALRRLNGLDSNVIYPGQKLIVAVEGGVPTGGPTFEQPRFYEVRPGDTLWSIAQRFGTTVAKLRRSNHLPTDSILYPGQRLSVPGGNVQYSITYTIERGDTLWSLAHDFGVTVAALRRWNGLGPGSVLYPGQTLTVHTGEPRRLLTYEVERGDTLWSIASHFSVEVADLRDWNGIPGTSNLLHPGQELRIIVDTTS